MERQDWKVAVGREEVVERNKRGGRGHLAPRRGPPASVKGTRRGETGGGRSQIGGRRSIRGEGGRKDGGRRRRGHETTPHIARVAHEGRAGKLSQAKTSGTDMRRKRTTAVFQGVAGKGAMGRPTYPGIRHCAGRMDSTSTGRTSPVAWTLKAQTSRYAESHPLTR